MALRSEDDEQPEPIMDELTFWRTCCERGITVCRIPKPFREEMKTWLIEKHPTFVDRNGWTSAYTFDLLEDARASIGRYFVTGIEPTPRTPGQE
ncbi:hypothetical protein P12x_005442 [Tundrisphaera lichenicola]|uniref:hypothetical protein n=1 Tax=Tundrisphaera lichenicola TaxID=2029860 RepID=UPI003EBB4C14